MLLLLLNCHHYFIMFDLDFYCPIYFIYNLLLFMSLNAVLLFSLNVYDSIVHCWCVCVSVLYHVLCVVNVCIIMCVFNVSISGLCMHCLSQELYISHCMFSVYIFTASCPSKHVKKQLVPSIFLLYSSSLSFNWTLWHLFKVWQLFRYIPFYSLPVNVNYPFPYPHCKYTQ